MLDNAQALIFAAEEFFFFGEGEDGPAGGVEADEAVGAEAFEKEVGLDLDLEAGVAGFEGDFGDFLDGAALAVVHGVVGEKVVFGHGHGGGGVRLQGVEKFGVYDIEKGDGDQAFLVVYRVYPAG